MKLEKPKNNNYAAIVVTIKTLVSLQDCDNVQGAIIFGNQVIVSKDIQVGDKGLYFPLECQLSHEYTSNNNLYKHSELNVDKEKKGYFENNRRIRAVKFKGHKSEGLFMPLTSLDFLFLDYKLSEGDEFDTLGNIPICNKYIVAPPKDSSGANVSKQPKKSAIVENQFRFHDDTNMLYKNLSKLSPEEYIHISYKLHGTSGISAKLLCKKKLDFWDKIGQKLGFNVINAHYNYIYSSRNVIKSIELNPNAKHYYESDIWGLAHNKVKDFLTNGLTLYYEIVGYLPSGRMIQKGYDYGQEPNTFEIYIYRITYTNSEGKVFEFSARQVQEWCKTKELKAVPELYYGRIMNFYAFRIAENWGTDFLDAVKLAYNEKNCYLCSSKVPEEGCVVRLDKLNFEAYKQKSNAFYAWETKQLDKGESNIEDEN